MYKHQFVLFLLVVVIQIILGSESQVGDGCVLLVPDNPLTPQGLMTPWVLMGANCNQATLANSRFVHAVIVNTQTGQIVVYDPLVVSKGMTVVSPPAPVNFNVTTSVVGIWLGSNSNFLTLGNANGIANGRCVTGPNGSPFGQFAWCNADVFWQAMTTLINQAIIILPTLGNAVDGQVCPTLRDFFIVDMDPDDGVQATYLLTANNQVVQNTALNLANFNIQGTLANDGDNRLMTVFVNPAIGCQTLTVPNAADPGKFVPALPLNVMQAMFYQNQPVALTPNTDPMTTTNGQVDLAKLNLYRLGVNQPQATIVGAADNDPVAFCRNYAMIAVPRYKTLVTALKAVKPPAPGTANLFAFMIARSSTTYANLNCATLTGTPDPFVGLANL